MNAGAARAIARRCAMEPEEPFVGITTVASPGANEAGWAARLLGSRRSTSTTQRSMEGMR